jgi:hypothetical protein
MKRLIRDEPPLGDKVTLARMVFQNNQSQQVFDRSELINDSINNSELFGYYGLSLWGADGETALDSVLKEKCRRSKYVALFTAAELRDKGLGIVPSGKFPHYDTSVGEVYGRTFGSVQIFATSAEDLVDRFMSASYKIIENRHYIDDIPEEAL